MWHQRKCCRSPACHSPDLSKGPCMARGCDGFTTNQTVQCRVVVMFILTHTEITGLEHKCVEPDVSLINC